MLAALAIACGSDREVKIYDEPPQVTIGSPVEGQVLEVGEAMELRGTVVDDRAPNEELDIRWWT